MAKQVVLVTGATGAQGGSVARHLLKDGSFEVRALTRNPRSDAARDLSASGAEVVAGDLADRASLDVALDGCHSVFGVTNFWEHFEAELEHGLNLIDAVAASSVKHMVSSTLPSAELLSGGILNVPHFEIKARLETVARERSLPVTFVHIAFYYENFLSFFPPRKQDDGTYVFGFPQGETRLAAVAVEDLGGVLTPIFKSPTDYIGRVVGVVGDDRPPAEYAAAMTRVLDRTVVYQHIPREVFASFDFPGAADLADMFEMNRLYITDREQDLAESRALYAGLQSFESWVSANRGRFEEILG